MDCSAKGRGDEEPDVVMVKEALSKLAALFFAERC